MFDAMINSLSHLYGLGDPLARALLTVNNDDMLFVIMSAGCLVASLLLLPVAVKKGMLNEAGVLVIAGIGSCICLVASSRQPMNRAREDAARLRALVSDTARHVAINNDIVEIWSEPSRMTGQKVLFGDTVVYTRTTSAPKVLRMSLENAERASKVLSASSNVAERTAGLHLAAYR